MKCYWSVFMVKEVINCLIIGLLLGSFGLFILDRWISQSQQQTQQIVFIHKQSQTGETP